MLLEQRESSKIHSELGAAWPPPGSVGVVYGPQPYHPVSNQPQSRRTAGGLPLPVAVEAVPGTPYAVAVVGVAPTVSGPAAAGLAAGITSIIISFVVACFAGLGARPGWGVLVAGAFAVLAAAAGIGALVLGRVGLRQVRSGSRSFEDGPGIGPVQGRGLALAGTTCGLVGLALTALTMVIAVLFQAVS